MNVLDMHRNVWIVVIVLTSAALSLLAIFWSCDPVLLPCLTIERFAAVVTVLSLTISPGLYFAKQRYSDKAESERAATAVYMELVDASDALDSDKYRDLRSVTLPNQDKTYFMSRLFNHDVYDSLVNSGKITFIDAGLQQSIQDVFQRIKDHNTMLKKLRKIQEGGGSIPSAHHLYTSLGSFDDELRDSLPEMIHKIKSKYAIS